MHDPKLTAPSSRLTPHPSCLRPRVHFLAHPLTSLSMRSQRARNGNQRSIKELTWGKRLDMLRDVAAGM